MAGPADSVIKRALDLTVALALLILLSPVLLCLALAIRLTSPGPALYRARRTGLHGKPFTMYKFRSMVANAERIGGTSTASRDPRITRLGHFMRKYKLDELPQLLNVARGNMSLVGPRPEVEEYTSMYSKEERRILDVLPGMTDLASLRYRELNDLLSQADDPDAYYRDHIRPEKNALRLKYATERSFRLDLWILWQTFLHVVLRRRGHGA